MFLDFAVPAILLVIYLDSRGAVGAVRAGGPDINHSGARNNNLLFVALTLMLTATLIRMADVNPDLRPYIRTMVAFTAVFNMTTHWAICHFLARLNKNARPIPATVCAMYRDPRRINYLDQAAYWTLVFEALPYIWQFTG
jgi:hypothetical protein